MEELQFEEIESISRIPAGEWDALSGHHVVTSHAWLSAVEASAVRQGDRLFIVARDSDGLAGAIQCRLMRPGVRPLGFAGLPALVCGPEAAVAEPVLVRATSASSDGAGVAIALVKRVERIAQSCGWAVCFRNVNPESRMAPLLDQLGYIRTREWPTTFLDLPWKSFQEYRRALRRKHPATEKNISQERKRGERLGLSISPLEAPSACRDQLHLIMSNHFRRMGQPDFPFKPSFFEELTSRLNGKSRLYAARLGDDVVGLMLLLMMDGTAHMRMIGFDPARGRPAATYFNLGYNRPIEDCINAGYRRIFFGRTQYDVKIRRGCALLPMNMYVRAHGPLQRLLLRAFLPLRSRALDHRVRNGA